MTCTFDRSENEITHSMYKNVDDLVAIKAALFKVKEEEPISEVVLTHLLDDLAQKEAWGWHKNAGAYYARAMRTWRLLVYNPKTKRYRLSPFGSSYTALARRYFNALTHVDKIFFLKHLLYVDSHNCGRWICYLTDLLKKSSLEEKAILKSFQVMINSETKGYRIEELATAKHKIHAVLRWCCQIGIMNEVMKHIYSVTEAARPLHDFFNDIKDMPSSMAVSRFRESNGVLLSKICSELALVHNQKAPVSMKRFVASLENGFRRLRQDRLLQVEIPALRSLVTTDLLTQGYIFSDTDFDEKLTFAHQEQFSRYALGRAAHYSYEYPFYGLKATIGSYYYFDISN